jgi:uncharacterized protein (DUF1778 family)
VSLADRDHEHVAVGSRTVEPVRVVGIPAHTCRTNNDEPACSTFGVVLAGPIGETAGDRAEEVVLNRRLPDLDAVQTELMEEADVLGLDPKDIQAFVDQVGNPPSDTDNTVLTATTTQLPETFVEVRYSNAGGGWVLNYSFSFRNAA